MRNPIDGETRILGVLGENIAYTLSPAIQNAALAHARLNCRYVAFSVTRKKLGAFFEAVRALDMPGVNVTIPHKEEVIRHIDSLSRSAKRIGAVNTVVNRKGSLRGENTDLAGFRALLNGLRVRDIRSALVLGAGGAARAVLVELAERGVPSVRVACRRPARGKALLRALGVAGESIAWRAREEEAVDLVVNTTPLGQNARDAKPVGKRFLRGVRAVTDLVVKPGGTSLVKDARSLGVPAEEGSLMLVEQGRESFYHWFGRRPPRSVMMRALEDSYR
ncbi:MAG: shikimate dehydrogenase [Gemmatimonadetes bacterium]|nr:shikimate dehydrogenase [Gemmatimonadota bacterium]